MKKTRTLQTAEILAAEVGLDTVPVREGMKSHDDVTQFAEELEDDALYVRHQPHMGKLVCLLVVGDETVEVAAFSIGSVVCIERDEGGHRIIWMLKSRLCGC